MSWRAALAAALLLAAGVGLAGGTLQPTAVLVPDSATSSPVQAGDAANKAVRVNVVAGGAGGGSVTQGTSPWVTSDNHTTAPGPISVRLSDGASFYTATGGGGGGGTVSVAGGVTVINGANALAVDASGRATVNVSGTVPVSGTVTTTPSGTQTVSGSVTAVQPTGSNFHVAVDSAPTTAVTGAFFQATQPVSSTQLPATLGQKTSANSLPVVVASDQALSIFNGTLDAGNSSTVALGANAAFTGASFDAFNQTVVTVSIFSNVASAASGVSLQWSSDGANWDEVYTETFTPGGSGTLSLITPEHARFFRLIYTNGGSAQASFRLQVIHKLTAPGGDVVDVGDPLAANDHAQIVRALAAGYAAGGAGAPVNTTVKAASTAPVATDTAQVVTLRDTAAVSDTKLPSGLTAPTSSPAGTEAGLIVRPIPSGTQPVSGTVAVSNASIPVTQSGSWTGVGVTGTVTAAQATAANLNATVVFPAAQHVIVDSGGGSNASVGTVGATAPGSATLGGGSDGTTLRALKTDATGQLFIANPGGAAGATITDAFANPTSATPGQSFLMGWNGTTWDRIVAEGVANDAEAAHATGVIPTESYPMLFNGATFDRQRGSIANGALVDVSRVQGTVTTSGTATVSQATGTNLHAVIDSGAVTATVASTSANQGTAAAVAGGWPVKITDGTSVGAVKAASTAAVAADPAQVVTLSPNQPALTTPLNVAARVTGNAGGVLDTAKGTQSATALGVQELKDAGRASAMYTASVASTAVAETLITLTKSLSLAATTTCSSCTITTGKKFRVQGVYVSARNSTGTVTTNVTVNLRAAVAGATTTASPLQVHTTFNLPASAASVVAPLNAIPDAFEIDSNGATNTFGVTITHPQWVTGTQVATFDLSIVGYEY